jgi:hypothetical protein
MATFPEQTTITIFINFVKYSCLLLTNDTKIKDFDLLWLQSTPTIAAIFYHKYLNKTHTLYCPDDEASAQQPREIAKNIIHVMNSVGLQLRTKKKKDKSNIDLI